MVQHHSKDPLKSTAKNWTDTYSYAKTVHFMHTNTADGMKWTTKQLPINMISLYQPHITQTTRKTQSTKPTENNNIQTTESTK